MVQTICLKIKVFSIYFMIVLFVPVEIHILNVDFMHFFNYVKSYFLFISEKKNIDLFYLSVFS
jgi:hypothetical protein